VNRGKGLERGPSGFNVFVERLLSDGQLADDLLHLIVDSLELAVVIADRPVGLIQPLADRLDSGAGLNNRLLKLFEDCRILHRTTPFYQFRAQQRAPEGVVLPGGGSHRCLRPHR